MMAWRGGLGPVYAFEWLTASRRWQMYAWRSGFVALLLFGLVLVWSAQTQGARRDLGTIQGQATIARQFYQAMVFTALVMVLLAAPAATAGAICQDKARGTLLHVLVTDLSDAEVVLGKLAARLVPVLGLIGCSLPVMALATLLGGIDPVALTGSFLVLVGLAVLGCSIALLFSVWGRKTHEVLLSTYLLWILWLLMVPAANLFCWYLAPGTSPPDWIERSNVFVLSVRSNDPTLVAGTGLGDQVLFLAGALVASAALVLLTVKRLRPVVVGQWGSAEHRPSSLFRFRRRARKENKGRGWGHGRPGRIPGPSLDGNPVLWREWHRKRPSRWARNIRAIYVGLAVAFSAVAMEMEVRHNLGSGSQGEVPALVNGFQVAGGLLLLSVMSATSLSEERVRGSLDILLATPLSTRSVLWGKWWGAYRGVFLTAFLAGLVASLGCDDGRWLGPPLVVGLVLAYGAAINSLGLALATWIRSLGRVLTLCVGCYVAITIGWVALMALLFSPEPGDSMMFAMMMGSPFYGVGVLTVAIEDDGGRLWPEAAFAAAFWIAGYATLTAVLVIATRDTFDRCLGRIPDRGIAPRRAPLGRKPEPKPAVAIAQD